MAKKSKSRIVLPVKKETPGESQARPSEQEQEIKQMTAAAIPAPPPAPVKTEKTSLELVQSKYPERFGKTRSITEIATDGKKTYFRVNYYDPSAEKFASYWVAVENGKVNDESK